MELLKTLSQAWKVEELRKKILFTLMMLVVYRIGSNIPVPGINRAYLSQMFSGETGLLDLFDLFSGGSFSNFTIFALSITPYVTASIIVQLLTIALPYFERLSKEGNEGHKKMATITRYMTVVLGLIQAIGLTVGLFKNAVVDKSAFASITIIMVLTAGTVFLMWLGEQITEYGIGNGISMILFASIISRLPTSVITSIRNISTGSLEWWVALLVFLGALAIIVLIVYVNDAERRVPVQYAKRVVGRKMYGGQSTHLPMKVNMSGVLPIIFAQSIASLPITIWTFIGMPKEGTVSYSIYNAIDTKSVIYMVVYFIMIIGFSYFYSSIQFNPVEIANNLKKQGGFIPGFRPGQPTVQFIQKVLNRITMFGAIYLGIVAICPLIVGKIIDNSSLAIGGTSVIIVVGVALETVKALEAQMLMRHYKGFLD